MTLTCFNDYGDTSLHLAVNGLCTNESLQEIISQNAYLNAQNSDDETALWIACSHRQQEMVMILLKAGSNVNIADHNGKTSLHAAVLGNCRKNIIRTMFDHGAYVNATDNNHTTSLMLACEKGNLDAINVLLRAGADRTIKDAIGDTWIHYAIRGNCSKEVLQSIIDQGDDVNATNKKNVTSLMLASEKANVDAMNVLLSAGADRTIKDADGDTWIHYAIRGGCSKEVLQSIIDQGAYVNTTNNKNVTFLMLASEKGNVNAMNVLLRAGADRTIKDANGDTWIHYAIRGGCSKEVLQSIIDQGADVNATNKKNVTFLMLASEKGNVDAMNVLLSAGADRTIKDANGDTWIHYAVRGKCSKDVLRSIIAKGADVNATSKGTGTPLMLASWFGKVDAIKVLLSAGADRIIKDAIGNTWIHYAIRGGCSKEVLQSIIDQGADVNATNKKNVTSLMLASEKKNVDAMNVLLRAGADRTIKDADGDTWIHYAIRGWCSKEVLQSIIDQGADVNATNKKNVTFLMLASEMGNVDAMNVLLRAGADRTIKDAIGNTWIHYAIRGGCSKEVLQSIIDQGAYVNATNKKNVTSLMLAMEKRNVDAMNVLLRAGADRTIKDANGNTWIHYAIRGGCSKEVFQSIIDQGAYVNATNKKNVTFLMLASEMGNVDAMNVLLRAGADRTIKDANGDTWINYAIRGGCSKEVLQSIIDQCAYVNATNKKNVTFLMLASEMGNVDAMNVLLRAGADRTIKDANGDTWIHYAIRGGCSKEVLQSIIDQGAYVNATNKKNVTFLMLASEKGNVDAMNVLLSAGADRTIKDAIGDTWIHYAIRGNCSKDVLQSIIAKGADVNATSKRNSTPLMLASWYGKVDAIKVLLSAGADRTIKDAIGDTWIHYAIRGNCNKEVLQSIIDHGADVNATNEEGDTPLMLARKNENEDAINVLLSTGANRSRTFKDAYGDTWIHYAVRKDCSNEVLQSIIDQGDDVNATNKKNVTSLMLASEKGNVYAMNVLLSAGADRTIKDANGDTWIHYAIHGYCSIEVLQSIIDQGDDVNATNKKNVTSLMLASEKGNVYAMNVLLRAGADRTIKDANGDTWIHYAIRGNCNREVLQSIIDQGADVNATNKKNVTSLMLASEKGNVYAMNVLLRAGADRTIKDANGDTWIHYAIHGYCSIEVLQSIIDQGAYVNATNKKNVTSLMLACEMGDVDAMNVLLSAGADRTIKDADGYTWFHYAVHGCSKDVLQSIIAKGADVNATSKGNGTPLMLASWYGQVDAIKVLLSAGADQTIKDANGYTWIHYAVRGGCSKEVLQSIIDHGADVNVTNEEGDTPLMLARKNENEDAINVLLSTGANRSRTFKDAYGDTWIHYAVRKDCSNEVLQSIIDQGDDVNATNKKNVTSLMLASEKGNVYAMNVLLRAGADRTIKDANGDTWIHHAIHGYCSIEVLQSIIDQGADVNATNKQNVTSLMLASEMGNVDAMNVLLSAGADRIIKDAIGNTWIHYAIRGGCSKEVLQSIIDQGADVNATNKKNVTSLMLASEKKNVDAMNVLLRAGADRTIKDANGDTWIHYAIRGWCSKEVLQSIIDQGADVNATNKKNVTFLMLASEMGNVDAMNVLLRAGADRTIKDAIGNTWIHYAIRGGCSKEVLQSIIDQGAYVNATNKKNVTSLMLAMEKRNVDAMNVLLRAGADRTIKDANGNTWIHYAIRGGCSKEVFQSIIDQGAYVNATNKKNVTFLMLASEMGNVDTMNVLLRAGADRTIKDANGDTWINYAIRGGCSKEVLQSIIDQCAYVNATNKKNVTFLMLASEMGNVDAMNVLLRAGADRTIKDANGDTWIHYAIRGGCSKEVLQSIIDQGAYVNATNKKNVTFLMLASEKGNVDAMNVLLSAGADRTIKDAIGDTWIHYAIRGNCSKDVLQSIIAKGADVNATSKRNSTPLMLASWYGKVDAIKVLLSAGADRTIKDANGDTWIHYAICGNCNREVLQSIIDQGADVNATNKKNVTSLMLASEKGNVYAMNVLLRAGADRTIKDANGDTWIHYAIHGYCSIEVLQSIIDQGAYVNATNKKNVTSLMLACEMGDVDAMNVLLSAGADRTIKDADGYTWIHYAVRGGCSKEVLQSIIDHGADVNVTNEEGDTPLMLARKNENEDAINVLLSTGANRSRTFKDAYGDTWIHYAVRKDCSNEVLQSIIDQGDDVNATNKKNVTSLMLASEKGNVYAMNVLLRAGADRTIKDANGDTWIHHAIHGYCSIEVLQSIIDQGADVNATNKKNVTSLMLASEMGNVDAMNVLLSAGADRTIKDADGYTWFHYAVHGCSKDVLQSIIAKGADVNATSKGNGTPLMLASWYGTSRCNKSSP